MPDLHLSGDPAQSVIAQIYAGPSPIGSPIPMTEISGTGEYLGSVPAGTPAGQYLVVFFAGPVKLASGLLAWDGTQEVTLTSTASTLPKVGDVLPANVVQVNSVTVAGTGEEGSEWGPSA